MVYYWTYSSPFPARVRIHLSSACFGNYLHPYYTHSMFLPKFCDFAVASGLAVRAYLDENTNFAMTFGIKNVALEGFGDSRKGGRATGDGDNGPESWGWRTGWAYPLYSKLEPPKKSVYIHIKYDPLFWDKTKPGFFWNFEFAKTVTFFQNPSFFSKLVIHMLYYFMNF